MFGDSITRIGDVASEVQVTFASGAARSFDLVVGADGPH
jgi:2-polyprenyl-6-methoxyphenol hydroxylase-like FAD-dependent oxidoreductase